MQDVNDIEKQYLIEITKAQFSCRDEMKKVIATNNKNTILSCAKYITSKSNNLFSPCQFLYSHIYKLDNGLISNIEISTEIIDFSIFDKAINLSNCIHNDFKSKNHE